MRKKCFYVLPQKNIRAYLAGFFDGEGSISIKVLKQRRDMNLINPQHYLDVQMSNINPTAIFLAYRYYGGWIRHRDAYSRSKRKIWRWQITGPSAKTFLSSICPFLRIKKERAGIAIAFQKTKGKLGKPGRLSSGQLSIRETFRANILKLNQSAEIKIFEPIRAGG